VSVACALFAHASIRRAGRPVVARIVFEGRWGCAHQDFNLEKLRKGKRRRRLLFFCRRLRLCSTAAVENWKTLGNMRSRLAGWLAGRPPGIAAASEWLKAVPRGGGTSQVPRQWRANQQRRGTGRGVPCDVTTDLLALCHREERDREGIVNKRRVPRVFQKCDRYHLDPEQRDRGHVTVAELRAEELPSLPTLPGFSLSSEPNPPATFGYIRSRSGACQAGPNRPPAITALSLEDKINPPLHSSGGLSPPEMSWLRRS